MTSTTARDPAETRCGACEVSADQRLVLGDGAEVADLSAEDVHAFTNGTLCAGGHAGGEACGHYHLTTYSAELNEGALI